MDPSIEKILLVVSILLFISILAGKASFRIGVPTAVLFLFVGMLAGSEGIGGIEFDNPSIAQFIGIIALNFILFSGGFETDWSYVRPVVGPSALLSIFGVLITAIVLGIFVWLVTDFTLYEGLLLGSIVSSTDSAAVFSILRSKKLALKGHLRSTLEFESGSNDPMASILTIIFITLIINPSGNIWSIIPLFLQQFLIGGALGLLFGFAGKFVINKIQLDYEGLYPPLAITLMLLTYSATNFLKGNGFLAVYISALYLGNQELFHKRTIMKMFDGLAWLMQIILFTLLGLLVFPSHIVPVIGIGFLISVFLILVARPVAVFSCLLPFRMKNRERLFISWVGLRGASSIVFATFPFIAGLEKADTIFNIVFFISFTSVLLQGATIPSVAKWLHVALPARIKPVTPADILLSEPVNTAMAEVIVSEDSPAKGKKIIELDFPENARIALLNRGGKFIIPNGQTEIMPEDKLILIATSKETLNMLIESLCVAKLTEM
ncbi:MAG TPA: potassium/proton antiporter [Bacteroidales bacterium]|nr:potassium/proton antiporter [Bacteroidales bacterium]HCI55836.1 potassium/proton antiporter [Bacteroidales bacterium]HOU96781.1 potassium/proton antiporter [Bacteroidales bacterium]HQG53142.1 potassium/proton antiporter [Bacteroidales bacterium]HQJ20972.1 potassium/proton antiporter [Bacteroidales bacterium]